MLFNRLNGKCQLDKHSEKKASLFVKMGVDYILTGRTDISIFYLTKASRCNCGLNVKTRCFMRDGKRAFKRILLKR